MNNLYTKHFQPIANQYQHKNCGGILGLVLDEKQGNHYWLCEKCSDIFTIDLNKLGLK